MMMLKLKINHCHFHISTVNFEHVLFSMSQGSTHQHISIWHLTFEICQFWAKTWKQKLFSMSQGSTCAFDIWHLALDIYGMSLLSIVVQNVPRINISIRHLKFDTRHLTYVTFKHRHENKRCSACPDDQHLRIWHMTLVIQLIDKRYRFLLSFPCMGESVKWPPKDPQNNCQMALQSQVTFKWPKINPLLPVTFACFFEKKISSSFFKKKIKNK